MSQRRGALAATGGWVGTSVRASAVPFLASRAVVLAVLGLCRLVVGPLHLDTGAKAVGTVHSGLLAWDAAFYLRIAEVGYAGAGRGALRFFPLFPLAGRLLGALPLVTDGAALVIIANLAAFAALVALHGLVTAERLGRGTAATSVWFLALFPAAFVLVMGYAEAVFLLFSILAFWAWRAGRFPLSIIPSFLAGLTRPTGVLLVIPCAVEVVLVWRARGARAGGRSGLVTGAGRLLAIAAPAAGAAVYLGWVRSVYGSFTLPLREQLSSKHRGGIADPVTTFAHELSDAAQLHHLGSAMHAPFVVAFVLLTLYACIRLPASYGWYALATMAVALTAPNLDSFERYGLACFPFAVALGCLCGTKRAALAGIGLSALLLAALSALAFLGIYVP